jgi:hypothetical protein
MNRDTLPQGNNIRQLLVKSSITNPSINSFLKEKGVFLGRMEKNNSVPLLMKSLISPADFINLYAIQKVKEENVKHRTASINCTKDFELSKVFNETFNLNQVIKEQHTYRPDYKVVGAPKFYFEGDSSAVFEYKIERENTLNDWTENKTQHKGSLRIEKDSTGKVHISVQQNSTSKETQEVNTIMIAYVKEKLNSQSLIELDETFTSIKFNDFDNTSRIKFLNSFANDLSIYTKFKSVTDLNLFLDSEVTSHTDIETFLNEIENLRLKGKSLHNHVFINTDKYHEKLQCASINLRYKLNYKGVDGSMYLFLSFPDFIKSRTSNSELQTQLNFSLGNIKGRESNIDVLC